MLSSTVLSSFFSLCRQTPEPKHVSWCWWSFFRASLCTWTETWQWPWKGQLFFVGQGSVFFYRRSRSTSRQSVKWSLWGSRLKSGFWLGRLFQAAKIEYDLVSIFGLPKLFMIVSCVCFWKSFFNLWFRLHYLHVHDPFCGFLWARRTCGLFFPLKSSARGYVGA